MRIYKNKSYIKADIDHVYKFIRNIETLYDELILVNNNEDLTIHLTGNTIEAVSNETLLTLTEIPPDVNYQFKALINPVSHQLLRFGNGYLICTLSRHKNKTIMTTEIVSENNPSLIWRVFIKIIAYIMAIQSRSYEKAFIKKIELRV